MKKKQKLGFILTFYFLTLLTIGKNQKKYIGKYKNLNQTEEFFDIIVKKMVYSDTRLFYYSRDTLKPIKSITYFDFIVTKKK